MEVMAVTLEDLHKMLVELTKKIDNLEERYERTLEIKPEFLDKLKEIEKEKPIRFKSIEELKRSHA